MMKIFKSLLATMALLWLVVAFSTCSEPEKPKSEITTVNPVQGSVGTAVTINGKNLSSVETVSFGATTSLIASKTDTKIETVAPPGLALGTLSISVKTDQATSNSVSFLVLPSEPEITSIEPAKGSVGMEVTLIGKHLNTASSVLFGTKTINAFISKGDTEIKLAIPAGLDPGALDVTVTTDGGTSEKATFTVVGKPTISSLTPAIGPAGKKVSIAGTFFEDASKVKFGEGETTVFEVKNAALIEATVPATATTGKVSVTTPGGEAVSATNFVLKDAPKITSFTPASGIVGTVVTINGESFDAGNLVVKFGAGTAAIATLVSPTKITATVPASATTGKITVETASGLATSATNFTVIGAPTVASFTPTSGGVGIEVTITGTNFVNVTGVKFNTTTSLNFTIVSPTQLKVNVPTGATTGKMSVVTNAGTGMSSNDFTVISQPTITSLTPEIGPVGRIVSIAGTFFNATSKVKFGAGEAVTFQVKSANLIEATVPATATTGKVTVTTPGGEAVSAANFVVKDAPKITSFTPETGIVGTVITINGESFDAGNLVVKFGTGTATAVTLVSPTKITATVPASATTGKISVETASGLALSATNFTVIGAPTVTSFAPTSAGIGVEVTITGTNFVNVTSVKFNTTVVALANFTVVSPTQIKVNVPAGATTGKITVVTSAGTGVSANNFTVLLPPTITSFNPANGAQGSNVVITGTEFTNVTSVRVNDVEVGTGNFTINSSTQITAKVPASATSGKIKVTNPQGTATSAATFYVTPFISTINPTSGSSGATITLTGTNLGAAKVKFNTTEVTPTTNTNTTITVVVPAIASGAVNVTVVNLGGTSNSKTFTVISTVVLDEIIATANIKEQLILLKGTNLLNASKVLFNSVEADVLTNTSKVVTAIIPSSLSVGSYSVKVVTSNGTSNGKTFQLLATQNPNTGDVNMVNGASVVAPPGGYVPPVSNQWTNTFDPDQRFFLEETNFGAATGPFTVEFSINFNPVATGSGTYDKPNNYIEFTLAGIRYVGIWTPRNQIKDQFDQDICVYHMTLISAESGKQLELAVDVFGPCE